MTKKSNSNTKVLERVVLKSFKRVIKEHSLYPKFIIGTGGGGLSKDIAMKRTKKKGSKLPNTPFQQVKTVDGIMKKLSEIVHTTAVERGMVTPDTYDRVTMAVNHLLHFYLELAGLTLDQLSRIGSEVYEKSIRELLGDEAVDSTEPDFDSMSDQDLCQYLLAEYMKAMSQGVNLTITDFIKQYYGSMLELRFNRASSSIKKQSQNNMQQGFALGEVPEGHGPANMNGFIDQLGMGNNADEGWLTDAEHNEYHFLGDADEDDNEDFDDEDFDDYDD